MNQKFIEFVSNLKHCFEQSVIFHHQTDSYAQHKALNEFYDGVLDLLDDLIESTSGVYGKDGDYFVNDLVAFTTDKDVVVYFEELYKYIETTRTTIYQESWIQNQVDEIAQLVAQTMYKLTLK